MSLARVSSLLTRRITSRVTAVSSVAVRAFATKPDMIIPSSKKNKKDNSLAAVVDRELKYEEQDKQSSTNLEEIAASLGVDWEVVDEAGMARFALKRTLGAQQIRVDVDCSPVPVHGDDEWNEEEQAEEAEEEQPEEPEVQDGFRMLISISDPAKGQVMQVGTFVTDHLQVEKVALYQAGKEPSPDAIFGGSDEVPSYAGPNFEELDSNLQDAFYEYLRQRGVDDDFSAKVADYCTSKEQVEYVNWLQAISNFTK